MACNEIGDGESYTKPSIKLLIVIRILCLREIGEITPMVMRSEEEGRFGEMADEATRRVRSATGVSWGGMAAGWMSGANVLCESNVLCTACRTWSSIAQITILTQS